MYQWHYNKVGIKVSKKSSTSNDTEEKINVKRRKLSQKVNPEYYLKKAKNH